MMRVSEVIRGWLGWCPNASAVRRIPPRTRPVDEEPSDSPGGGDGTHAINPFARHGALIVALTNAACLLVLVAVLKKVLLIPVEQLSQDLVIWIIIYSGLVVTYPTFIDKGKTDTSPLRPAIWCIVTISVTLAIIGLNMFW
ncbi:MAG: hypothetical protein LUQ66_11650 [Methanoregula sp.]|nr:hypothetical protein [Methanoregula sp.]